MVGAFQLAKKGVGKLWHGAYLNARGGFCKLISKKKTSLFSKIVVAFLFQPCKFGGVMKTVSQANIPATKGNVTASPVKFILCKRVGKKWIGVAGTNCEAASCQSAAESVFGACGFEVPAGSVQWFNVETQKNYIGRADDFKIVSCTEREKQTYWLRDAASRSYYNTFQDLCDSQPFAADYEFELADIFEAKAAATLA